MKKFKTTMIFMTLLVALLVMPSVVFAETNCNAVGSEADLRTCLEAGESVKLTGDIEITTKTTNTPTTGRYVGVNISGDGDIVIDGDGHTISTESVKVLFEVRATAANTHVKFVNVKLDVQNQVNPRVIDTRTNNLKLTLDGVTMTAGGTGNAQGITVGGANGPVELDIKNSTIDMGYSGYGIISFNKIVSTIEDSTIEGYAALYLKGADSSEGSEGSVINVISSKLVGKSIHSGSTNAFGTVVFEDDGIEVNIVDTEIIATNTGDQPQAPFLKSSELTTVEKDIEVSVSGDSEITVDTVYEESLIVNENDKFNVTIGAGVESNIEIEEEYLEEGAQVIETEDGILVVKPNTITILENENGSITADKEEAIVGTVVTITVTPKEGYKVKSYSVKTVAGTEIEVEDGKFVMPNEEVVIGAEIEEVEAPVVPEDPSGEAPGNPDTADINLVATITLLTLGLIGLGYTFKKRFN